MAGLVNGLCKRIFGPVSQTTAGTTPMRNVKKLAKRSECKNHVLNIVVTVTLNFWYAGKFPIDDQYIPKMNSKMN